LYGQKKISALLNSLIPRQKGAKLLKFFLAFPKEIFTQKKSFLRAIYFSKVEAEKKYAEEKYFSSAPKFQPNIFSRL